jgi:hypothetical protein
MHTLQSHCQAALDDPIQASRLITCVLSCCLPRYRLLRTVTALWEGSSTGTSRQLQPPHQTLHSHFWALETWGMQCTQRLSHQGELLCMYTSSVLLLIT